MLADLILTLFKEVLLNKSKKSVYFFYSADFGSLVFLGLVFIFYEVEGLIALCVIAVYIAYFFREARKKYVLEHTPREFAKKLLQWSLITMPVQVLLIGLLFYGI